MSWLSEGIEKVVDLTRDALEPELIRLPYGYGTEEVLVSIGGEITKVPRDRWGERHHIAGDYDSFVASVKRWCKSGSIWIDSDKITALADDQEREDKIVFRLQGSAWWREIQTWPKVYEQRTLINKLRTTFRDVVAEDVLHSVRTVNTKAVKTGEQTVDHGKESMGRSVQQELVGASDLVSGFAISGPVYDNLSSPTAVRATLEFIFDGGKFGVDVVPDDVVTAQATVLDAVRTRLVEDIPKEVCPTIVVGTH